MQALFKFRAVPRSFVRSVMGKPYAGDEWELWRAKEKKEQKSSTPAPEKFTKSFQDYLDSRLTYEEMMNQSDAEKKKSSLKKISTGEEALFDQSLRDCPTSPPV